MIPRILTGVALTGMLAAAGCGGGGSSGAKGFTPAGPGSGSVTPASSANVSFSMLIPQSQVHATTAASVRQPKYLSPGSTGISVLLGNGSVSGSTGLSGTASLLGSVVEDGTASTGVTISTNLPSTGIQPVVGQTLTLTHVLATSGATFNGSVSSPLTVTNVQAGGSIITATYTAWSTTAGTIGTGGALPSVGTPWTFAAGDLVTFSATGGAAAGQTYILGNTNAAQPISPSGIPAPGVSIASTVHGATSTSAVSYNYAPSTTVGYYTLNVLISNLTASTGYYVGVQVTDLTNHNFILSEGSSALVTLGAGGTTVAPFTLKPVVNGVYVPAPAQVVPFPAGSTSGAPLALSGSNGNSLSTTVFATDELGYVIPTTNVASPIAADNAPASGGLISIGASAASSLTFGSFGTYKSSLAGTTTTLLTSPPTSTTYTTLTQLGANTALTIGGGGAPTIADVAGAYFTDLATAVPNSVTFAAPVVTNGTVTAGTANAAGNPINIICTVPTASVGWAATINSLPPTNTTSGLAGVTYTTGTNYPATQRIQTLTPINCSPGVGGVIN